MLNTMNATFSAVFLFHIEYGCALVDESFVQTAHVGYRGRVLVKEQFLQTLMAQLV